MIPIERTSFALSALLFAGFTANVLLGAFGFGELVGDVSEMLLLFGASIFFVFGILMRERSTRSTEPEERNREEDR